MAPRATLPSHYVHSPRSATLHRRPPRAWATREWHQRPDADLILKGGLLLFPKRGILLLKDSEKTGQWRKHKSTPGETFELFE